jgi:hypothetical protein
MTTPINFRRHLGGALVASFLFLASAPVASAQDAQAVAAAETLFQAGKGLMAQSKFDEACPKFAESYRLNPLPGTSLNLANCYKQSGKTASAWAQFREASFQARKNNQADREAAATQEAAALEPNLSKLQINAEQTPGLLIRRDNQEVGAGMLGTAVPVDPGPHTIEATAPGYSVWSTSVVVGKLKDSKTITIPLLLKNPDADKVGGAAPAGPNKSLRTASYVVGGVGVVGLVVGGVFGGLAASGKSKLKTECPNNACPAGAAADDLASTKGKATISTIGIAVGGAALATGVVLFIVSGKSESKDDAKPMPAAAFVPVFGPQGGGFSFNGSF